MIKNIQFTDGYAMGCDALGSRKFEFTPGLNVLFGPNGCGKSTILKTCKAYCGIPKGGWSRIIDPIEIGTEKIEDFPGALGRLAPEVCRANVEWDGVPTFYNEGNIQISDTWFFTNQGVMDDGITTEAEQFEMLAMSPSSGEFRLSRLNKIFDMMNRPPLLDKIPEHIYGNRRKAAQAQIDYIKSLPRSGPVCILFDEPERALSITKQEAMFEVIEGFAKHFQIIVATHSLVSLYPTTDVNLIDMLPGYIDECKQTIDRISKR